MGNARHRHTADGFAPFLAGEREFQQAGELDRILEEALEEVPEAVEQNPLGVRRLQLHVMAQHRGQLLRIHLAVVGPGGQIVVLRVVRRAGGVRAGGARFGLPAAAGSGGGIGAQVGVGLLAQLWIRGADWAAGGFLRGFMLAEQAALQGEGVLLCHQANHCWPEDTRVVLCRAGDASADGAGSGF